MPAATVRLDGNGQLTACAQITQRTIRCDYGETGRNTGPGCATEVRGRVRIVAGETEIAAARWFLPNSRVLMPDEEFNYTVKIDAAPDAFKSATAYATEAEWKTVRC